jgi:hypothetical protein
MRPAVRFRLAALVAIIVLGCAVGWFLKRELEDPLANLKHDPIEDDPAMKPVLDAADRETVERLAGWKTQMGLGRVHASMKKQILREKYGVEWRTPMEMNPRVVFD